MAKRSAPKTQREVNADRIIEARKATGPAVANQLSPSPGTITTKRAEDRAAFWHRSLTREQESALWNDPTMDLVKVSQQLYRRRWEIFSKGRPDEDEQIAWIEEMIRLGPIEEEEESSSDELQSPDGSPPEFGY